MFRRLQRLIWALLAALVLLVLHLIHGTTLLLALFLHLFNHVKYASSLSARSVSPARLQKDKTTWQARKIPKCLGVVFVPAARGSFSIRHLSYKPWDGRTVYEGMVQDVEHLVAWAKELKIENLVIYDENGILKQQAEDIQERLRHASHIEKDEVFMLSSQTFMLGELRISLLAREDGKEHVAKVTRGLSKGVKAGFIAKEDIDVDFVQEKLYSSLCAEPDLLIVLGGLHLRLRGFPPWHVRLSEIYHDSSLGLLGPPRLRYAAFKRAMDNYAGCQQRFGK